MWSSFLRSDGVPDSTCRNRSASSATSASGPAGMACRTTRPEAFAGVGANILPSAVVSAVALAPVAAATAAVALVAAGAGADAPCVITAWPDASVAVVLSANSPLGGFAPYDRDAIEVLLSPPNTPPKASARITITPTTTSSDAHTQVRATPRRKGRAPSLTPAKLGADALSGASSDASVSSRLGR